MQLPQFALQNGLCWTVSARLPSWVGFQARTGAYSARSSNDASDGSVTVRFAPEGRGCESLDSTELALISWFLEHEAEVSEALQTALVRAYPDLRDQHGHEADGASNLPEVRDVKDLKAVIGLHSVNVHQVCRDEIPYIGFEFGCDWDEARGLGVLMCGTQVVEIGGADTAILLWLAERHARTASGDA